MPDKTIVADKLQKMEEALQLLIDGTANINSVDELLVNAEGMLKLKGICMGLLVRINYCQNIRKFLGMRL
ncbi:MAG: hypothetical protein LBH25_08015 [Fibromonadaceae bacterium]|jgi:hypothetical protein|nr:hypothetical protein [Fibromonadaceae bacterium]